MPEGPQVRRVANIIARHVGESITEIRHPASRAPWELKLPVKIDRVITKGKNIFVYLSNGQVIYNHMLMWGWWLPGIDIATTKRLNTAFITDKGNFGYYGGGILKLISADEAQKLQDKLGVDILTAGSVDQAFAQVGQANMPIGEALLAQELVSGIGNIYKSEGLFIAKIHPSAKASTIPASKFQLIFNWLQPQMQADVLKSGKIITTSREAAKAGRYNFVYRRFHQPCLFCGTKIERIYQGKMNRSTYFCPKCQAR